MLRVLILDDDPLFGRTLRRRLESSDLLECEVVAVVSEAEALEAVRLAEEPFGAFLIDQRLGPGHTGIEVMRELLDRSPGSQAVVFTEAGNRVAGFQAYEAGAFRYLHKPLDVDELIQILRKTYELQQIRREADTLGILTKIAVQSQQAQSVREVCTVIVEGVRSLGFERARLWLRRDDSWFVGAAQAGNIGLLDFAGTELTVAESIYVQKLLASRTPLVFTDMQLGPSFLLRKFGHAGYQQPAGPWVGLPLWIGERCTGIFMLDNVSHPRPIDDDRLHELHLLAQQAAVALDHARWYERERHENHKLVVLNTIARIAGDRAASGKLPQLLMEIWKQIGGLIDQRNFMMALLDRQEGRLDFRLEIEDGQQQPRSWLPRTKGLVSQVIAKNEPLLLPAGGKAYREQNGIPLYGRQSRSWLGVPLRIGGKAIGAIVVQSYDREGAFGQADLDTLTELAAQVAGPIETARLREDAAENSRRLEVLQQASAELMRLAADHAESQLDGGDEQLWHLALTVATAGFGLGFNRAMLFLSGPGGSYVKGRMGIGHLTKAAAQRHWTDPITPKKLAAYLEQVQAGSLEAEPVDKLVRPMALALPGQRTLVAKVLETGVRAELREQHTSRRLPRPLVDAFYQPDPDDRNAEQREAYACALVPIRAPRRTIGLLLVDNRHNGEPIRRARLDQLETWLAQVALAYDNMRQRQAREQIIRVNHAVLAQVTSQPLRETLTRICEAAMRMTEADCAVIYPLVPGSEFGTPRYDVVNTGHAGLLHPLQMREEPGPRGVTHEVLRTRELLRVDDIQHMPWFDAAAPHSSFLVRERIRAFIAVPIADVTTKAISGILYLDFREPQRFGEQDERWPRFFAEQAGAAMHIVRAGEATRSELQRMHEVLEQARDPEIREDELYIRLLKTAQELLHQPDARVGLLVRGWGHLPEQDPVEVRHQYFLVDGSLKHVIEHKVEDGITGYVFRTETDWLIDDVREPPWNRMYYSRHSPDTRSELDVLIQLGSQQAIGLLNVESPRVSAFTEEHHEQLRRLALIAALALDNRRRQTNLGILRKLATAIITAVDVESTLRLVVDALRDLAPGAGAVTTWYRRPESVVLLPGPSFGVRDKRRMVPDLLEKVSVLSRMLTSTSPILSEDPQHNSVLNYRFVQEEGIVASAAFPLRAPKDPHGGRLAGDDLLDDEVVGVLFINYRQLHVFSNEEKALFEAVAALAAAGIRDAQRQTRLEGERHSLERERRSLETAMGITTAVGTTLDLDETLRTIMEQLRALFSEANPLLGVLNYDPNQHRLAFTQVSREFYPGLEMINSLDVDGPKSIACYVARTALATGEDVVENVPDVLHNPYYMEANPKTRSELCLALMSPDTTLPARQRLHGVLVVESEREHAFDDKVDFIRNVGQAIGIAIERSRQRDRLRFSTTVGNVTGWVNEIAHDIKTELRNINFSVHQLKKGARGDAQGYLREIDASIERLRSSLRAPRDADKEPIAIDSWLQSQVDEFFEARRANILRTYDFHCEGLSVLAAQFVMERALKHLLRNAYEAMGKEGRLAVRTMPRNDDIEVQISNSGPAIPEYIRPRLFTEQVSGKHDQRDGGGGGLGLLFARLMIEGMGGRVYLVPTGPDEPVTFGFVLPRSVDSPAV